MSRSKERLLFGMMLVVTMAGCNFLDAPGGTEVEAPDPNAFNVLFIGNSLTYTNDLPGLVEVLIEDVGVGPINVSSIALPNVGLEDHWVDGRARETIQLGNWDVIVLQQGPSATEGRPSLLEYSAQFADEAERIGAETALYMVWPSSARFFDFDGVSESYTLAAEQIGGLLYPVGEAWRVAWESDSTLAFYSSDGFHPSELGTYIAALVVFEQMTGRSPLTAPRTTRSSAGVSYDFPSDVALAVQTAAREANARFARR